METREPPITIELNPHHRRLWERIRGQWLGQTRWAGAGGLGELLLLLPDLAILLLRLVRDPRVPRLAKAIGLAGAAYLLSPLDFMPSLFLGPVGLVDDLVVVALSLSAMLNHTHPDVVRSHWPGRGDALVAIRRVTAWVEERVVGRGFATLMRLWSR